MDDCRGLRPNNVDQERALLAACPGQEYLRKYYINTISLLYIVRADFRMKVLWYTDTFKKSRNVCPLLIK